MDFGALFDKVWRRCSLGQYCESYVIGLEGSVSKNCDIGLSFCFM